MTLRAISRYLRFNNLHNFFSSLFFNNHEYLHYLFPNPPIIHLLPELLQQQVYMIIQIRPHQFAKQSAYGLLQSFESGSENARICVHQCQSEWHYQAGDQRNGFVGGPVRREHFFAALPRNKDEGVLCLEQTFETGDEQGVVWELRGLLVPGKTHRHGTVVDSAGNTTC